MKATTKPSGELSAVATLAVLLALASALLLAPAPASAAPPQFWQKCDSDEPAGQRCDLPRGIAANPENGRLYVAHHRSKRVVELSAWGEFLKAWGWGVVDSGPNDDPRNEIQQVEVDATGGDFRLKASFLQTTGPIAFNATAAAVQAALEALPDPGSNGIATDPGDFTVTGPAGGPWAIEFTGANADADVPQLQIVDSTLTGGTATATVATIQQGANFEVCVPADGDVCRAGQEGSKPGQMSSYQGIALDSAGSVYIADRNNFRVQKFSSDGNFLFMFGDGVNQGGGTPSSPGNLCAAAHLANGDACGAGSQGNGPGEFESLGIGDIVEVDPDDDVWVGGQGRIQRFDTDGIYQSEVAVSGGTVQSLAIDSLGNLYVTYSAGSDIHKLSPAGTELATFEIPDNRFTNGIATAVDVDGEGHVYAFSPTQGCSGGNASACDRIFEFDPDGNLVESFGAGEFSASTGLAVSPVTEAGDLALYVTNIAGGAGASATDHFLRAYSPVPDQEVVGPPPLAAPAIADSFVRSVESTEAQVGAAINPHFWEDTSYYLEYGTAPCSSNLCTQLPPAPLSAGVVATPQEVQVELTELDPGTTYHFRFVAQSSGGGLTEGPDRSFTTYAPAPPPQTDCPNQEFRTGPGAFLPDCRAYEMVSPVDKNGTPAEASSTPISLQETAHFRTTPDGAKISYNSAIPFAEPESAPASTQYIASRDPSEGWFSDAIDPPIHHGIDGKLGNIHHLFDGFSEDLSHGWLATVTDPPPDPAGVIGYRNLYRRDNVTGVFTAITTVTPPTTPPGSDGHQTSPVRYTPHLGGFSADGSHTVFAANDRLVPGASNATIPEGGSQRAIYQLYEWHPGGLRLVSRLPDGTPSGVDSVAGGSRSFLTGAVSDDGERIYWTAGTDLETNAIYTRQGPSTITGKVYVRVSGTQTVAVSESVPEAGADADARFWVASSDGSAALFSFVEGPLEGDLYRFELADPTNPELIATGLTDHRNGVGGASEDLTRVFFSSQHVLDTAPNSEGDVASSPGAFRQNVYFYEQGEGVRFVAAPQVLTEGGGEIGSVQIANTALDHRSVAVTPDGSHLLFVAFNPLTGYDSTSQNEGRSASQVFRYDAKADELSCVSCNPTGARPVSRPEWRRHETVSGMISAWRQGPFYRQRVISEDGSRVWFQSFDRLLPADTNGKLDVYEWRSLGAGVCATEHPHYFDRNEGCLELITTGSSSAHSEFIEATSDGSTVFVRTAQTLVSSDIDELGDIYAARMSGGFPSPPQRPEPCEGEACRGAGPEAPGPAGAGSAVFEGPPDPQANWPKAKRCPKGKRKVNRGGRTRCVAKKRGRRSGKSRANRNRRNVR